MEIAKKQIAGKHFEVKDLYVNDSLFAIWDAIDNTGKGRDPEAKVWTDCINGYTASIQLGPAQSGLLIYEVLENKIHINGNLSITNADEAFHNALYAPSFTCEAVVSKDPKHPRQYVLDSNIRSGTGNAQVMMWQNESSNLYCDLANDRLSISPGINTDIGYFVVTQSDFMRTLYAKNMQSKASKQLSPYAPSAFASYSIKTLIGSIYPYDDFSGNGYVCSVRLHTRALSEEELKHNYEVDKVRFGI